MESPLLPKSWMAAATPTPAVAASTRTTLPRQWMRVGGCPSSSNTSVNANVFPSCTVPRVVKKTPLGLRSRVTPVPPSNSTGTLTKVLEPILRSGTVRPHFQSAVSVSDCTRPHHLPIDKRALISDDLLAAATYIESDVRSTGVIKQGCVNALMNQGLSSKDSAQFGCDIDFTSLDGSPIYRKFNRPAHWPRAIMNRSYCTCPR